MKARLLLILSLGLNLALAGVLLAHGRKAALPVLASASRSAPGKPAKPGASSLPSTTSAQETNAAAFNWHSIESTNYPQLIANLRAVNCPETTLRDFITGELDDVYSLKRTAATVYSDPWENADRREAKAHLELTARFNLNSEKRAFIKELLGYEWDTRAYQVWQEENAVCLLFGFLPDAKVPPLMAILDRNEELMRSVKNSLHDIIIDEDRARFRQFYETYLSEVSQMLTPFEREEFHLRLQALVTEKYFHFEGVLISAAEFREFVRLSLNFIDAEQVVFFEIQNPSPAEQAEREAAFNKQAEAFLGPARFADYQRASQESFREGFEFVEEHHLPAPVAVNIFDARQAAEQQAAELRADKTLSSDEHALALAVLKNATTEKLTAVLGSSWHEYQTHQGRWLEQLVPPPAATNTNPTP